MNYACYKAILCDRAVYLLEMVRYLPLNPGRMRSAVDPWAYRWSSHGTYLAKIGLVGVNTTVALGELAKSVGHARRAYLRFIGEGKGSGHQSDFYDVWDQRFLGDERFVEQIDERIRAIGRLRCLGQGRGFQSYCV